MSDPVVDSASQGAPVARDPLVDRSRAIYLYVVSGIAVVQGVLVTLSEICGRKVDYMPLATLVVLVAPAVAYMFSKGVEQLIKAVLVWKGGST